MAAETVELATIYLVDLVGSTRMATSVGPVRADALREEFFGLLREAIDASGGREFKNTGDGLMVAFTSASAAVGCAVLTQQLFERRYRGAEQRLRVRIGLGTGESTVKDGDYFGMPAIEAARLCDKAPADGILVSPATKLLAGRVDGARFESFGELELKGIPEPMEAFAVVWEPLADESGIHVGAWPVPAALRIRRHAQRMSAAPASGGCWSARARRRARAHDRRCFCPASPGSGRPGLLRMRRCARMPRGSRCAGVRAARMSRRRMSRGSRSARSWSSMRRATCSMRYVAAHGGEVGRLARNLARRVPDAPAPQSTDPETERFLLFKAVGELLLAVARSQPLCVVLDDFHWADGQSVALLRHVVASGRAGRADGDRHLSRLGAEQGSPADRRARGSAAERGRGADPSERAGTGRGCGAGGCRGGPRARCRRSGARGWTRDRDRRQPILRRRDPAQPDRVRRDHVRRDGTSLERRRRRR